MKINYDQSYRDFDVAVIGMDCRFPGADNTREFWENLCQGKISQVELTDEMLLQAGVPQEKIDNPHYVKKAFQINDVEMFDPAFFGFTPKEAELMDPQQRLLLQTAFHTLEDAGYAGGHYEGNVGVFVGASTSQYLLRNIVTNFSMEQLDANQMIWIENDLNYLATMISYKLNLTGPSINVQSACSTSLVAVAQAYQSLINYESDMAIAGGCRITIPQNTGYMYAQGEILSPNGECRPFDADGHGTVVGSGAGMVALKRLSDAVEDGNQIIAVIKGSAVNNDGSSKVGFAAPSVEGEYRAVKVAQMVSEVDADTITYVETHGTATELGDPIEIQALTEAFGETKEKNYCALGAVKANIGHLDTASGVAGFIKTCLALKHKKLPPNVNFVKPNPNINFEETPFYVNKELMDWNPKCGVRRAGVSSFGFGGTNVHMVLEEAVDERPFEEAKEADFLMVTGRTKAALKKNADNLIDIIKKDESISCQQVAMTINYGRKQFPYRSFISFQNKEECLKGLESVQESYGIDSGERVETVFLFPGQGTQYVGMGKNLYETEPVFRESMKECADIMKEITGCDILQMLYENSETQENQELLMQTEHTHKVLFAIEYATAKMLMHYGIVPDKMIGHSIGEYVAACISGVLNPRQAIALVCARGMIIQSLPKGSMLSVNLSEEEVKPYLEDKISLAIVNTNKLCVLAGTDEDIKLTAEKMGESVSHRILHTSHAFHSYMMEAGAEKLKEEIEKITVGKIEIPYLSNVTGDWITQEDISDPEYWIKHMTKTVRFYECLKKLDDGKHKCFFEAGPGGTLSIFVRNSLEHTTCVSQVMRAAKQDGNDRIYLYNAIGKAWMNGMPLDTELFLRGRKPLLINLPGYAFDKKKCWIGAGKIEHKTQDIQSEPEDVIENSRDELSNPYQEPENELEETLVDIMETVMGIHPIGVTDNLIEIGVHSLIVSQILVRVNDLLNLEITMSEFMSCRTIREFSDYLFEKLAEMLEN